jgi:ssRNA-specific RNase YbeY (16S rRNA maturation enzyme)
VPSIFVSKETFPTINFNGWRTNTSTDVITLNVYNNNSGTACGSVSIGGSNGAWATSGNVAAGTCVINPGDVLTLDAHLANGGAGDFVRIGEINISYLANF